MTLRSPPAPTAAAFILRVALGTMWLTHAIVLKWFTFGLDGLARWMAQQGFPAFLAGPLVLVELAGGLAILLGIHGRWASLMLLPVLAGATFVHAGNGWVFSNPNGGWEYPVFLVAASLAHACLGDGRWSLRGETV